MFWRPLASAIGPRLVGCTALCAVQWRGLPHTQRRKRSVLRTFTVCLRARTSQYLRDHSPHSYRRCLLCTRPPPLLLVPSFCFLRQCATLASLLSQTSPSVHVLPCWRGVRGRPPSLREWQERRRQWKPNWLLVPLLLATLSTLAWRFGLQRPASFVCPGRRP